jgi:flagellar hook protein FlgE
VASIINGLFAGRAGISSHGSAIAVAGDNISNANTIGYKTTRAEFQDLLAGTGVVGRQFGSGSSISSVSTLFEQGTLEFTGRPLDLGISGNGYFVVARDDERFFTRAGNFKVDSAGFIVSQNGLAVLGFPANGSGALEPINLNTIDQGSIESTEVAIAGNLDASTTLVDTANIPVPGVVVPPTVKYSDLNAFAAYSSVVDVLDSLGEKHTVSLFFYHTDINEYTLRAYVNNEEVDTTGTLTGYPRLVGEKVLAFGGNGQRNPAPVQGTPDFATNIAWNNESEAGEIGFTFSPMTQYSAQSNILSITQDGKGIGAVTTLAVSSGGEVSALLTNGQNAVIGTLAMATFSNPEGLTRLGGNLLSLSTASGEPVYGRAESGNFGSLQSGVVELSTVDIASEFVKIITLQRGFQASSRIITTINQLLNEIIQLA